MDKNIKIYVAGHKGMVGSAIFRKLNLLGYSNLIGMTSNELDLTNQIAVNDFYNLTKPEVVIDAAARVGGILANNDFPYTFLMENMQIQNNLIDGALKCGVKKFIFLGSSCIYPKYSPQPIKEDYLLSDSLEPTNQWYAIAKISGIKSCEAIKKQFKKDYISLMPTNLYGYNDNFDLETSHVIPAMIRKFHEAKLKNDKSVVLWGTGKPMREFLFAEDLADAVIFSMENKLAENMYNIGTGNDISIRDLATIIKKIIGYQGDIIWDNSKPDGTPKKLMDISKMESLGWKYSTNIEEGIKKTYDWFLDNIGKIKEIKL